MGVAMPWMKVSLSADAVAEGSHIRLQDSFEEIFITAAGPARAAMIESSPNRGEYVAYFSPDAVSIFISVLSAFGAVDCDPPQRAGAALLVGHADALDMLGPSRKAEN